MRGVIGTSTPRRVRELISQREHVSVTVMEDVPGSLDDHANLRAARLVRTHGLATFVPRDGVVASGQYSVLTEPLGVTEDDPADDDVEGDEDHDRALLGGAVLRQPKNPIPDGEEAFAVTASALTPAPH